eukprot:8112456-Alexandrium_andersonii.AAC.1
MARHDKSALRACATDFGLPHRLLQRAHPRAPLAQGVHPQPLLLSPRRAHRLLPQTSPAVPHQAGLPHRPFQ